MSKKQTEGTEVAVVGGSSLPTFMSQREGVATTGMEDSTDDRTTPRLQLAQDMSDEVKKRHEKYIEGLEAGGFFDGLSRRVLGDKITVAVVKQFPSRVKYFDRSEGSGMDCYSPDSTRGSKHSENCGECPFSEWQGKTPPACSIVENFIVVLEDGTQLLLGIRQTNKHAIQEARAFKSLLSLHANHGVYAVKYELSGKMVQNNSGDSYYVVSAKPIGYVENEAEYNALAALAEQFKDINHRPIVRREEGGDDTEV